MYKWLSLFLAAFALVMVVGCSKAPEAEKQAGEAALLAAQQAEADQYASSTYQMALDTLNAAKAAMEEQNSKFALFRKYGKVKEMFIAGKQLADQAVTEAQAEKERVRLEVTNLMTQADALLAQAQTALDKAPRGKGSKADIEMLKNDLASIRTAYTEAGTDFQAGKYLAAKAKIEVVMTKAQDFIRYIEEAKTKAGGR